MKVVYEPESMAEAFGLRVWKARQTIGLSAEQFGLHIGLSGATVSKIENGRQGVTLNQLFEIARVLRVRPYELIRDTEKMLSKRGQKSNGAP